MIHDTLCLGARSIFRPLKHVSTSRKQSSDHLCHFTIVNIDPKTFKQWCPVTEWTHFYVVVFYIIFLKWKCVV